MASLIEMTYETHFSHLQECLKEKEEFIIKLENDYIDAHIEIKRLKEEGIKLKEELEEAKAFIKGQKEEIAYLKNKTKDQEVEFYKKELVKWQNKAQEAESRLTEATQHIGQAYMDGKRDAQQRIEELEKKLHDVSSSPFDAQMGK